MVMVFGWPETVTMETGAGVVVEASVLVVESDDVEPESDCNEKIGRQYDASRCMVTQIHETGNETESDRRVSKEKTSRSGGRTEMDAGALDSGAGAVTVTVCAGGTASLVLSCLTR